MTMLFRCDVDGCGAEQLADAPGALAGWESLVDPTGPVRHTCPKKHADAAMHEALASAMDGLAPAGPERAAREPSKSSTTARRRVEEGPLFGGGRGHG